MKWLFAFLFMSGVVSADLYDRNKWGLDWERDDAYGNYQAPAGGQGRHTTPVNHRQCPCDPGDPECPCEVDDAGVYHRVD